MPVSHQDHRGIPEAPSISRGGFHQPLDLSLGEVLAGAQVARPPSGNCSVYGGWGDQSEVPLRHGNAASSVHNCSINSHFMVSMQLNSHWRFIFDHPIVGE